MPCVKKKKYGVDVTIMQRVCNTYVKNSESHGDVCCCGYAKSYPCHKDKIVLAWNESCTEVQPTNADGELKFNGYGRITSKYIRVDHNTEMNEMKKVLNHWKLPTPKLMISVTGGAQNFEMEPRLKEVFSQSLMKAAGNTGAWIITGGMHAGVMKHVGEAVRQHVTIHGRKNSVVVLGISPWGCVRGKEDLMKIKDESSNPNHSSDYQPVEHKVVGGGHGMCSLDPNHSHFILVDNGTQHKYGTEIGFRANLESYISDKNGEDGSEMINYDRSLSVPRVCLVLGGGEGTLDTVQNALENRTPVVIVEGTGRIANVLAHVYDNFEDISQEDFESLQLKLDEYSIPEKKTVDEILKSLQVCMKNKKIMNIVRLHDRNSDDIERAIIQVLLEAIEVPLNKLKLALAWNRIDIAESDIFTNIFNEVQSSQELSDLVMSAIKNNNKEFVKLFMRNGVSLVEFLTRERLQELYNCVDTKSLLHRLLVEESEKVQRCKPKKSDSDEDAGFAVSLSAISKVIRQLTGGYYQPCYTNQESKVRCCKRSKTHASDDEAYTYEDPGKELFIWSVLNQQKNMAMLFWNEVQEPIAAALLAQQLTKSMRGKNDLGSELRELIIKQEEAYGDLAADVLYKGYSPDEDNTNTRRMLIRKLSTYGGLTCLELAVLVNNKKFVAHEACQTLIENIWMGKMQNDNSRFKIAICMILPVLICWLIKFKPKMSESEAMDQSSQDQAKVPKCSRFSHNCCSGRSKVYDYFSATCVKFYYSAVFYMLFLLLYSYVLLVEFTKDTMLPQGSPRLSPWEMLLIIWIVSFLSEELRQITTTDGNIGQKFYRFFKAKWNIVDNVALLIFIVGIILRLIPTVHCTTCFEVARYIYSFSLMAFFFRVLHLFSVFKKLGPKLDMIGRMMIDLCFFMLILMVFVTAYGVTAQAIMYPGASLNIKLIGDILQKPYFQMFGELFLDEIGGELCAEGGPCPDENSQWMVPILLGVYILITNVLMLNLLIAMFSYTFGKIQDRTDEHWRYQRYLLIKEYSDRSPFVPPLILLYNIFMLTIRICKCRSADDNDFVMKFNSETTHELILWEHGYVAEYIRHTEMEQKTSQANMIREIDYSLRTLRDVIQQMNDKYLDR